MDEKFPEVVEQLSRVGEIATHVHFRKKNGDFYSEYEFQKTLIENATDSLRAKGFDVVSFRGGDHFFNNDTLKVLEQLDYEIDSSVMQGFSRSIGDFVIDHKVRNKQIPLNIPYFPSHDDYMIAGTSNILEIPVTNLYFFSKRPLLFLPFPTPGHAKLGPISNLAFRLTKIVSSLKKEIPIVFLFHDFTFSGKHSLEYLRHFISQCSNDHTIRFVTLQEIKEKYMTNR